MNIKACIFDLDGVIVDTAKYHYLAWKKLADELGIEFTLHDNERLKGVSRMRSLEILLELGKAEYSETDKQAMATKKNTWYVDFIYQLKPTDILPGAKDFLIELREQGIKTALGSASKNAPLILEKLSISSLFDVIVDGNIVSRAKPDPEVFLKGAEALKVDPMECVVFEDAQAGIDAAKNAKMVCVGIGDEAILCNADIVVGGLNDISYKTFMLSLTKIKENN